MSRRVFSIRFFFVYFIRIVSGHRLPEPPVVSMYRSSVCGCSLFVVPSAHVDFPFARIFASMICLSVPSCLAVPSCPAAPSRSAIFLRLFRSDCIRASALGAACVSRLVLADVPASIFHQIFLRLFRSDCIRTSAPRAACSVYVSIIRMRLFFVRCPVRACRFPFCSHICEHDMLCRPVLPRSPFSLCYLSSSISFGLYPDIGSWSRPLWHMQMRYELFLQKYLQIPIIFRTFASKYAHSVARYI